MTRRKKLFKTHTMASNEPDVDLSMIAKETIIVDNGQFDIWTDAGDMLEPAVISWSARTEVFTAQSLCDYINSKGLHTAYTSNPNQ